MSAVKSSPKVVIGIKSHSGWAAFVVVAISRAGLEVIDRRRIELVEPQNVRWAKQPYHAAEELAATEARSLVQRAIKAARQISTREIKSVVRRLHNEGHDIAGCALLKGTPMPKWTIEQILSVHVRMHMAEGALFPDALARAITKCGLQLVEIREKELAASAATATASIAKLTRAVPTLGKVIGPPWGADQKNATLAAVVAFADGLL